MHLFDNLDLGNGYKARLLLAQLRQRYDWTDLDIDAGATRKPEFLKRNPFTWLIRYADHEPDWADGCIAVLCGYHKRLRVWTYDGEFQTIWRRPDGKAIPLAIK